MWGTRTDRETVIYADEACTQRLGHVLRSGFEWVVKCEGSCVVSHLKSRVLAQERLAALLDVELAADVPTEFGWWYENAASR